MGGYNPAGMLNAMSLDTSVWQQQAITQDYYGQGLQFGSVTTNAMGNYYQTFGTVTIISNAQTFVYPSQYATTQTFTTGNTYYAYPFPVETEEERIVREQNARDWQAKEDARRKRAKEALLLNLNEDQQKQFEAESHFELQVNDRLYRVRPGSRVERLNAQTKKVESYFCIHPELVHNLPSEDVALTQKLLLEANEAEFLRLANETRAA